MRAREPLGTSCRDCSVMPGENRPFRVEVQAYVRGAYFRKVQSDPVGGGGIC